LAIIANNCHCMIKISSASNRICDDSRYIILENNLAGINCYWNWA
jgi:hypothetical protein